VVKDFEYSRERKPILLEIFAPWCSVCAFRKPVLEAVAEQVKVISKYISILFKMLKLLLLNLN
jgi:hypothetical protein